MSWPILLDGTSYSAKAATAAFGVSRFVLDRAIELASPTTVGEMKAALQAYRAMPVQRRMNRSSRMWNNGGARARDIVNKVRK